MPHVRLTCGSSEPAQRFVIAIAADQIDEHLFKCSCSAGSMLTKFGHFAFGNDFAAIDDGDLIAETFDDFEYVRRKKNGRTVTHLFEQDIFHQPSTEGVHTLKG